MNDHLRQTGRTTRMLQRAIELAKMGRAVCVLAPTRDYARCLVVALRSLREVHIDLRHADRQIPAVDTLGIKFEVVPDDFDYRNMRPAHSRADQNCVWLLDHTVAEAEALRVTKHIVELQLLQAHLIQLST